MSGSIRARITLQATLLLAALFLGFALFTASCYYGLLVSELDRAMQARIDGVGAIIAGRSIEELRRLDPTVLSDIELWSIDGELIWRSPNLVAIASALDIRPLGQNADLDVGDATYSVRDGVVDSGVTKVVARHLRSRVDIGIRIAGLIRPLSLAIVALIVAAVIGARWIVGRSLAPVESIRRQAARLSHASLHERLATDGSGDELDQLSTTLNDMLARLEHAFVENERFTSDAAHELRTPLAAIRAMAEQVLVANADEARLRETLGEVLETVDAMTSLTESLLALARFESSNLRDVPFDMADTVRQVVKLLSVLAEDRGQSIAVSVPQTMPMRGDSEVISQALMNLIDNAIKYTPCGGQVLVSGVVGDGVVRVEVRDNGPGIALEHVHRVFDRFYRVDSHRSRTSGGFGIGLSIARRAVQLFGGTLTLQSTVGQGSVFSIEIPTRLNDSSETD